MKVYKIGGLEFDANIYLLIDELIALVDAGTGESFDLARKEIRRLGVAPEKIRLVLNTHCHYDHTGGDHSFAQTSNCKVAIHELEADLLRNGDQNITFAAPLGRKLEPVDVSMELKDGDNIDLGKTSLEVVHTPGHTAGSVCFFEEKTRTLFSGDTIFSDTVGRTDLETGNNAALQNSIERLSTIDVEKIYPGHGGSVENDGQKRIVEILRSMFA